MKPRKENKKRKRPVESPTKSEMERAYKEFAEPSLGILNAFAASHTNNHALAEDATEEAVIKIIKNARRWQPGRATKKGYAALIGKRAILDCLRKKQREEKNLEEILSFRKTERAGKTKTSPTAKEINALLPKLMKKARLNQKETELITCLAGLKDNRIKTYKETAAGLKIPIGTVKSRLSNIRKKLRKARKQEQ